VSKLRSPQLVRGPNRRYLRPTAVRLLFFLTLSDPNWLESRSRKYEQDDKWNFCLTRAAVAVNRRNHEQTTPPEPFTGLQGKGGIGVGDAMAARAAAEGVIARIRKL